MTSSQEIQMKRSRLIVLAMVVACAIPALVGRADYATPFVETNNKVGDVAEVHGYVLASDRDDGPLMVLVATDTMDYVAILAKADKGVVPPERMGRWSIIKAQVVKAPTASKALGMELKILGVRSATPATATQPK
jgi:hypothetical protein